MGVTARIKTNLSGYFAASAALFSRRTHELERVPLAGRNETVRIEHRSYAIGAVLAATCFLESSINELYLEAVDRNPHTFPEQSVQLAELMSHNWQDVEERSILDKYQRALTLAEMPPYPKGQDPYQAADGLVQLRNALVHYKPEWDTEHEEHRRLEKRIATRFNASKFASPGQAFFPYRCLGHGCAAWATTTAVGFYQDFMGRLGPNVRPIGGPAELATE